MRIGEVWRLTRGGEPVAEIVVDDGDFPWLYGRLVPLAPFEEFRPLFEEEHRLLQEDSSAEEWDAVYARISSALTLHSPDGPVAEYLLHVDGDEAWFRWID
ncbi:hypothetical protein [Actinokineospora diospyrosa]|uniref:hypothetical protein n=1 Tax=Actinokineospora diospyrosa TaxID=103728 RepID=UPI0020A57998|nr:hypothetical protein [Actinokineospora diospyrosa]